MKYLRNIPRWLAKYISIPINVRIAMFAFWMRAFFLGFDNANNMLQRLSKPCIIPILKRYGASIGEDCDIATGLIFHNCVTNDYSHLSVGNNCHIGKQCFFDLWGKVNIEDNVVISMKTTIITHQDMGLSNLKILYPGTIADVNIKNNCYIGVNSTLLKGITINSSSIIAACSLVIDNVPAFTIVGGIPAKELKKINGI